MTQLKKLQEALDVLGVDAIIVSSELNQRYLSGFDYTDGYLFITKKEAYLLADFRYTEAARAQVKDFTIVRPEGTMLDGLKKLIGEHNAQSVALEDASLSCADYKRFSEAFTGTTLCTGGSTLIGNLRAVKTEAELEKIDEELFGSAASDYTRAAELDARKSEAEARLLEIYEEIGV